MSEAERLRAENTHLRCVMAEAADEILNFWHVHAGEGGVGPSRLVDLLSGKVAVTADTNPYPKQVSKVVGDGSK